MEGLRELLLLGEPLCPPDVMTCRVGMLVFARIGPTVYWGRLFLDRTAHTTRRLSTGSPDPRPSRRAAP